MAADHLFDVAIEPKNAAQSIFEMFAENWGGLGNVKEMLTFSCWILPVSNIDLMDF